MATRETLKYAATAENKYLFLNIKNPYNFKFIQLDNIDDNKP